MLIMSDIALLIISLGIILVGAELFVNGVEWLGKLFNLSEGAVGSVLAAVGTALPETIIPVIAILFARGSEGKEIGIGAILGAPLMLSTLAMFVTGIAVFAFKTRRRTGTKVMGDYSSMCRDLGFFMIVYHRCITSWCNSAGIANLAVNYRRLHGDRLYLVRICHADPGKGPGVRDGHSSLLFCPASLNTTGRMGFIAGSNRALVYSNGS